MTAESDKNDAASQGDDVFEIDRIRQIVELMELHQLSEVDLQQGEDRIRLTRGGGAVVAPAAPVIAPTAPSTAPAPAAPAPADPAASAGTITINAPMVGTFYAKANPESPAFVKVGDTVNEETIVCIVEAMKVFNEIPAECRGKIVEILVSDQEPVDFGKPLFRVQTDA